MNANETSPHVRQKQRAVILRVASIVIVVKTTKVTVIHVAIFKSVTRIHVDLLNIVDEKVSIQSAIVILATNV